MIVGAYLSAQIREFLDLQESVFNLLKQSHNRLIDRMLYRVAKKVDNYYLFYLIDKIISEDDLETGLRQEIRIVWRELCEKHKISGFLEKNLKLGRKIFSQRTELIYRYLKPVFLNFENMVELVSFFQEAEKIARQEKSSPVLIFIKEYPRILREVYKTPLELRPKLENLLSPLADRELFEKLICPKNLSANQKKGGFNSEDIQKAIRLAIDRRIKEIFEARF